MTDAATEARAREILVEYTYNPDLAASLRANAPGCASGTVNTSTALRAIEEALSTLTPAGELREVVRREVIEEIAREIETMPREVLATWDRPSHAQGNAMRRLNIDDLPPLIRALAQPGSGEGV